MKKLNLLLVGMLVAVLVFGGCGGKSQENPGATVTNENLEKNVEALPKEDPEKITTTEANENNRKFEKIAIKDFEISVGQDTEIENPALFHELASKYEEIKIEDLPEIEIIEIPSLIAFQVKDSKKHKISGELIKLWKTNTLFYHGESKVDEIFQYNGETYFYWHIYFLGEGGRENHIGKMNIENGDRENFYTFKEPAFFNTEDTHDYPSDYNIPRWSVIYDYPYKYEGASIDKHNDSSQTYEDHGYLGFNFDFNYILHFNPKNGLLIMTNEYEKGIYIYDIKTFKLIRNIKLEYEDYEIHKVEFEDNRLKVYLIKYPENHWKMFTKSDKSILESKKTKWHTERYKDYWVVRDSHDSPEFRIYDKNYNFLHKLQTGDSVYKYFYTNGNLVVMAPYWRNQVQLFDISTGELMWDPVDVYDIAILEDSILALSGNEDEYLDLIKIDYETGKTEMLYEDIYYTRYSQCDPKAIDIIDGKIILDNDQCFVEKSKYKQVIIPENNLLLVSVNPPTTEDEYGWITYGKSGYVEEVSFSIFNNSQNTKSFEITNIDERLEASETEFTIEPNETKEIRIKQNIIKRGDPVNVNPGDRLVDDLESIVISWEDGEKVIPVKFAVAPYNGGD